MAWTYADWPSESTYADRLTRLRLHLEEVANAMGTSGAVSVQGESRDPSTLQNYYDTLMSKQLPRLEQMAAAEAQADGDAAPITMFGLRFCRAGNPT